MRTLNSIKRPRILSWSFSLLLTTYLILFLQPSSTIAQEVIKGLPGPAPADGIVFEGQVPQNAVPQHPVTLEEAISIGLGNQPSIRAAQASLSASLVQQQALSRLRLISIIRRDIPIRQQQAALGVTANQAALTKAEWETIYAITRNYFTVIYAQKQLSLLNEVINNLKPVQDLTRQRSKFDPDFPEINVDTMDITIGIYSSKRAVAEQGIERALAALREALGLPPGCRLVLAQDNLPPIVSHLNKKPLIGMALAQRGEMIQASVASEIVALEVNAQNAIRNLVAQTFAAGADIHAQPVPQGHANGEYRPWAVGIEMPTTFVGCRNDRVQRAMELSARAAAVVDKTRNLIVLETEDAYLKWKQASRQASQLATLTAKAKKVFNKTKASYELAKAKIDELLRAQGAYAQVQAEYNEALYQQALALAALERITAGGYVPPYRPRHAAAHGHHHEPAAVPHQSNYGPGVPLDLPEYAPATRPQQSSYNPNTMVPQETTYYPVEQIVYPSGCRCSVVYPSR